MLLSLGHPLKNHIDTSDNSVTAGNKVNKKLYSDQAGNGCMLVIPKKVYEISSITACFPQPAEHKKVMWVSMCKMACMFPNTRTYSP